MKTFSFWQSCRNLPAARIHISKAIRTFALYTLIFAVGILSLQGAVWAQIPPQAAAAGYTENTFSSTFTAQTVDVNETFNPGYQWYPSRYYYNYPTDAASRTLTSGSTIVLNSDGTVYGNNNAQISTFSVPNSGSGSASGIVGTAFGGGGYFEATLAFDPTTVFNQWNSLGVGVAGWPSWWAMAVEHLAGMPASQYWYYYDPSEADDNYAHFAETDFFEYNVASASNPLVWGGNMVDWFGDWTSGGGYGSVNTPWGNKLMTVPAGTNFTQFHKYGYLWVPATPSANGSATYYFDGVEVGVQPVTWSEYQGQTPPPSSTTPWTYGILDQQHIGLILGSGVGEPMTVQAVNVWQSSTKQNFNFGTLYDPLNGLTIASSNSNLGIDNSSAPADFNGDTSRAVRLSLAAGSLVYHVNNIGSFTARVYTFGTSGGTNTFAVSPDNVNWTAVPAYSPSTIPTINTWSYQDLSNSGSIPSGMNYLKVTLSADSVYSWDREIGQVSITSGSLYDPLNGLTIASSESNLGIDNSTPADFNGDTSRAVRLSLSDGNLVYQVNNIASFTARVYTFTGSTGTNTFAVSPDNVNWTTVPATSPTPIYTTNGWTYQDLSNSGSIPSGMKYLKITLGADSVWSWDREIGQVSID